MCSSLFPDLNYLVVKPLPCLQMNLFFDVKRQITLTIVGISRWVLRVSALEMRVVMDSFQPLRQKARVSTRQITQSLQQVLPDHKYTLLLFLLSFFDCCIRTFGHIIYV